MAMMKGHAHGLVDFVASLDAAVQEHLQSAAVLKGTSRHFCRRSSCHI